MESNLPKPKSEEAQAFVSFAKKLMQVPKGEIDAQDKKRTRKTEAKSA